MTSFEAREMHTKRYDISLSLEQNLEIFNKELDNNFDKWSFNQANFTFVKLIAQFFDLEVKCTNSINTFQIHINKEYFNINSARCRNSNEHLTYHQIDIENKDDIDTTALVDEISKVREDRDEEYSIQVKEDIQFLSVLDAHLKKLGISMRDYMTIAESHSHSKISNCKNEALMTFWPQQFI